MDWVEQLFDGPWAEISEETVADTERTAREAEFIQRELELTPDDAVLDVACGQGRHVLALAPQVKRIVGLDRTVRLIEYGRKWAAESGAANAEFVAQDARELSFLAEFDAAYNYFTAWGYYDDETNLEILRRIARALKPGGRFLIEMLSRDAVMRKYEPQGWRRYPDGAVLLEERRFDLSAGRQHSTWTYLGRGQERTIEIVHHMPTADHLALLLRLAGFSRTRAVEAPTGAEMTIDSWRMAVVGWV